MIGDGIQRGDQGRHTGSMGASQRASARAVLGACLVLMGACQKPPADIVAASSQAVATADPTSGANPASTVSDGGANPPSSNENLELADDNVGHEDSSALHLIDIGNGMKAPLGASEAALVSAHPGMECFSMRTYRACELRMPTVGDCPGARPCRNILFTIVDGEVVGFLANYDEGDWTELRSATMDRLGKTSQEHKPPIGSMSSDEWAWVSGSRKLVFARFSGTDIRGNPMAEPYSIIFGPIT